MNAPIPLPVTPWPLTSERLALLQAAKARIDTDTKIIPVEAHQGSPGRIFAWGVRPGWYCKVVPIAAENESNVDSIEAALRFWLNPWDDGKKFSEEWWLSQVFGCEVREVTDPFTLSALEVEQEIQAVRFS